MLRLFPPVTAALLGALVPAAGFAQQAQPEANSAEPAPTIGAPQLRNFQLEGQRTTPPADVQPAPAQTEPSESAQSDSPQPTRAPPTAPAQPTPRVAEATPSQAPQSAPAAEAPAEQVPAFTDLYAGMGAAPAPDAGPALMPQPGPETIVPAETSDYTLWYAIGLGLLLLLGFAWFRSRRAATPALARGAVQEVPGPAPAPTPSPRPRPAPIASPPAAEELRPWLEIEFKPEKLVSTDKDTSVHFQLLVKNDGKSEARNVRITAKMFNPSPDQKEAISAFFATPPKPGGQPVAIPPQLAARFKPSVTMPRESIRLLEVQGRPIFVPTVAISIHYEWGDGRKGQTCRSFLIGTEKEGEPSEKMGAFRLDLGPRIYRHVGGRPLELARAV